MVDRVCNDWTHVKQSLLCIVRSTVAQRLASESEEVYRRVEMMVVVRPLGCYSGGSHKIHVQALFIIKCWTLNSNDTTCRGAVLHSKPHLFE